MTPFSVWAPNAKKMEVEADGKRYAMTAGDKGWWYAEPPLDTGAADYAFVIDGGQPLPDPRSAWQPGGIHKASRLVDHKVFHWTDQRWQAPPLAAAVNISVLLRISNGHGPAARPQSPHHLNRQFPSFVER